MRTHTISIPDLLERERELKVLGDADDLARERVLADETASRT